jgi:hypothetical protein
MAPLDRVFALEVEFHRRLRCQAPGIADSAALHTSYALQSGYEALLYRIGRVTRQDVDRLTEEFTRTGDPRDALAARSFVIGHLPLVK